MRALVACVGALTACSVEREPAVDTRTAPPVAASVAASSPTPLFLSADVGANAGPSGAGAGPSAATAVPAVIELRSSPRILLVYEAASTDASLRGVIPPGESFAVYGKVAGAGCKGAGWGVVGGGAYACLARTRVVEHEPVSLPVLPPGQVVPFLYARPRAREAGAVPVPRYRSRTAMNRGDPPIEFLAPHGSYAFTRRHSNGGGESVLLDDKRHAVPLAQMHRLEPSGFVGRDLEREPVPTDRVLAWSVGRPSPAFAERREADSPEFSLPYHAPLLLAGDAARGEQPTKWLAVDDPSQPGRLGWVDTHDLRRWLPAEPLAEAGADELWIDIELSQQTLAVYRGSRPLYVTLISSGRPGDPTPRGLYRIETKQAYGKMRSVEDADEPYYVEAVPWAQYFHGRYALHASYWHDRFGRPVSHGCVNLSPLDARRVFELTSPDLPRGWLSIDEHGADPGTLVRVRRKGDPRVPDRRHPI